MWYETQSNEWINGNYFSRIILDNGTLCGCDTEDGFFPLTGRISTVPFPDKFVEVDRKSYDCSTCEGKGWVWADQGIIKGNYQPIQCVQCNGTGKVEAKND